MINKYIFRSIRFGHKLFFQKELPSRIAVYFHNVGESDLKKFEEVVDFFQLNNYAFCDPEEYISSKGRRVFISFDDNHIGWLKIADMLYSRGIKATFYCNTGPLRDISGLQTREDYFRRIDYSIQGLTLSSAELVQLYQEYNQCIGGHTVNHYNLAGLPLAQAKEEITLNRQSLEELIGAEIKHFSYPFGMRRHFNDKLRDFCIECGFGTISNAIPGLLHSEINRYDIARTMWDFTRSFEHNIINLKIDGSLFESFTGRSAISYH